MLSSRAGSIEIITWLFSLWQKFSANDLSCTPIWLSAPTMDQTHEYYTYPQITSLCYYLKMPTRLILGNIGTWTADHIKRNPSSTHIPSNRFSTKWAKCTGCRCSFISKARNDARHIFPITLTVIELRGTGMQISDQGTDNLFYTVPFQQCFDICPAVQDDPNEICESFYFYNRSYFSVACSLCQILWWGSANDRPVITYIQQSVWYDGRNGIPNRRLKAKKKSEAGQHRMPNLNLKDIFPLISKCGSFKTHCIKGPAWSIVN